MRPWRFPVLCLAMAVPPSAGATAQAPSDPPALMEALRLVEEGRYDEAIPPLRRLGEATPDDARVALYLGRAYLETGELDEAERWLTRAVELDETSVDRMWLGRVYGLKARQASLFGRVGLAKRMKENTLRALELDGDNLEARQDLLQFYLEAPGIAGGDGSKAREQAKEILARDSYLGHLAWARVYEDAGDDPVLIQWYRAAIRMRPEEPDPYYPLAYAQQRQGDFAGARETLLALQRQDPDDPGVLYQLGRNAALAGRWLDEGEASLRGYLSIEDPGTDRPSHAAARWRLALVLEHQGRLEEALRELEAAHRLDPSFEEAERDLKRLRELVDGSR